MRAPCGSSINYGRLMAAIAAIVCLSSAVGARDPALATITTGGGQHRRSATGAALWDTRAGRGFLPRESGRPRAELQPVELLVQQLPRLVSSPPTGLQRRCEALPTLDLLAMARAARADGEVPAHQGHTHTHMVHSHTVQLAPGALR